MPGITEASGFAKRFAAKKMAKAGLGFGFGNALGRGMTSPPISIALQLVVLAMYIIQGTSGTEDEEDEDRVRQDVFRFFIPYFINLGIEMWGKDTKEKVEHTMHFIPGVSELEPLVDPLMK